MYEVGRNYFKPNDSMVLSPTVQTQLITVKTGENLKKGQVIKMSTGKAVADDGLDISLFYGIITTDVDATTEDKEAYCYTFGTFREGSVIFPEGKSYVDYKEEMRNKGIILEKTQEAVNNQEG